MAGDHDETKDGRYPAVPRNPGERTRHSLAASHTMLAEALASYDRKRAAATMGRVEILYDLAMDVKEAVRDLLSYGLDPAEVRTLVLSRIEARLEAGTESEDAAALLDEATRALNSALDEPPNGSEG